MLADQLLILLQETGKLQKLVETGNKMPAVSDLVKKAAQNTKTDDMKHDINVLLMRNILLLMSLINFKVQDLMKG